MKNNYQQQLRHCVVALLFFFLAASPASYGKSSAHNGNSQRFNIPVDEKPIDRSNAVRLTSYAGMLEKATPAVVSIFTSQVVRVASSMGQDPVEEILRRFFGLPSSPAQPPSVEEKKLPSGIGSGVIVSPDGYVLTNNHVISGEGTSGGQVDEITVSLTDGTEYTAEIVGADPKTDIAMLKINADNLPYLTMTNSDNLLVGDIAFAIGNPMAIGLTVTQGIVSATGRSSLGILGDQGYENFIQTDASINPGNSGGALIDAEGRLIGINTAIISRSGGSMGIGFAIPSNLARSIMTSLLESGTVRRGLLGVEISDISKDMAELLGLQSTQGALVQLVQKGLPADVAGLQRSDVITKLNDQPIKNVAELRTRIAQTVPGSTVSLSVIRAGKELFFNVKLADLESIASSEEALFEGITVTVLDDRLRAENYLSNDLKGLLITRVEMSSPYARALYPGMVIVEINDHRATDPATAKSLLHSNINKLWVCFQGRYSYIALRMP